MGNDIAARLVYFEPPAAEPRLRFAPLLGKGTKHAFGNFHVYLLPVMLGFAGYWLTYGWSQWFRSSPLSYYYRMMDTNWLIDLISLATGFAIAFVPLILVTLLALATYLGAWRALRPMRRLVERPRDLFSITWRLTLGVLLPLLGLWVIILGVVFTASDIRHEVYWATAGLCGTLLWLPRLCLIPFILLDRPRMPLADLWRAAYRISLGYYGSLLFVVLASLSGFVGLYIGFVFLLEYHGVHHLLFEWLLIGWFAVAFIALWWAAHVFGGLYHHRIHRSQALGHAIQTSQDTAE